jgi:hypothetical protein
VTGRPSREGEITIDAGMKGPELSSYQLGYLRQVVRHEIRRHQPGIDDFSARPGQGPEDAAAVLERFREAQQFRQGVYDTLTALHEKWLVIL